MKVVYVAGPYRAENNWEIEQNIRRAEVAALEVWKMGAAALCPHTNTRFYQGTLPDQVWLDGDLAMMERCDAVLVLENFQGSSGTQAEIVRAVDKGIPVFYWQAALKDWLARA